ncbi:MAG: LysM peptidoglycan-binding domain-containing protein [Niameybacter sp.]
MDKNGRGCTMGTIIYDPNKKRNKEAEKTQENQAKVIAVEEMTAQANLQEASGQAEERYNALIENIDSVRPMGDTDCDHVIYLEDYVYTYIYQYANTDLASEHAAVIVGEYYPDSKETIICGIMPVAKELLSQDEEWINEDVVASLREEQEKYFPGANLIGWLHMQPGYGTMLTMKEVKAHREVFEKEGTLLLLVDPINKIETFYVYEDDTLKEQSGYYLYYDKNPCMQQYMLDRPFISVEKEEVDDNVVNQFREIGKIRKKEYEQKKKMNLTVIAASIALLALSAVVLKMNDQNAKIQTLQNELTQVTQNTQGNIGDATINVDEEAQFVISPEEAIDAATSQVTIIDNSSAKPSDDTTEEVDAPAEEDETTDVDEVATTEPTEVEEEASEGDQIANEEESKVEENKVDEATVPATKDEESTTASSEDYMEYVVQEGDSLRKISYDHYKTELRTKEIIAMNDLENGDNIYVGQTIKIPTE